MTSRSGAELPQLELDCLRSLWVLQPAPVAAVHASLAERGRSLAYTTVLTVLDRLRRKQVVARQRQGRAYVYTALITREEMRARALARLVDNYFDQPDELRRYLRVLSPAPAAEQPVSDSDHQLLD
ncbi:MAG TPA: BlaI/MecI/CopY family transcriptional regulator [Terriglobales bacterium]|nr:BlaI/MecI/CopY family transcriptional regulator [Terriglobales bacterium]